MGKCWLYKHEDMSSVSNTHVEAVTAHVCNPSAGGTQIGNTWALLTTQTNKSVCFRFNERPFLRK